MVTLYSLLLFAASFTVLTAGTWAWRRRRVPGGLSLSLTLFAIAVWCFFSAMGSTSLDEWHRDLWRAMSYVGLCNVAPFFLVFAILYSDSGWPLSPWVVAVLWAVPVATIGLAFTNGLHHLIWTSSVPGPIAGTNTVIYSNGPWYYFAVFWFLATCLAGTYHIVRVALRAARIYVLQAVLLIASVLIPWIGFLIFVLPGDPLPGLDTMSLGFALSAILMLVSFNRLRLLDLMPRARAAIVENMPDGFLVLDQLDRIVDINSTARRLLHVDSPAVGRTVGDVVPALAGVLPPTLTLGDPHDAGRTLEISTTPLRSRVGKQTGRVLLFRDISERQKLITDLQAALANVRQLSGLLPICASCKKIRDDKGYWHQVESYMRDHTGVEFSHGLCPECMAKLFPEEQV